MKVFYDHQTFSLQRFGGISRVFSELLRANENSKDIQTSLVTLFSNNVYLKEIQDTKFYPFFPGSNSLRLVAAMYKINTLYTIQQIKKTDFDLFHPSYYDPYFIKYLKGKPYVVTFHDLIHEKFENRYSQLSDDKYMTERKKTILKHAAKIIAVSESTKRDIIDFFGTDADRIEVIYLASSLNNNSNNISANLIKESYIMFVGNRDAYKNFSFFLSAVASVLRENKSLKLVCAGGGSFTNGEIALIDKLGLKDKVIYSPITNDNTLIALYSHAECFIFPSLYEGFGIPILEAFSCGCPLVVSNRGSLPEVAGTAALFCNPEDEQSIQAAVNSYLYDSALRQRKIREGFERLKNFSWEKTSSETFDLYKRVV